MFGCRFIFQIVFTQHRHNRISVLWSATLRLLHLPGWDNYSIEVTGFLVYWMLSGCCYWHCHLLARVCTALIIIQLSIPSFLLKIQLKSLLPCHLCHILSLSLVSVYCLVTSCFILKPCSFMCQPACPSLVCFPPCLISLSRPNCVHPFPTLCISHLHLHLSYVSLSLFCLQSFGCYFVHVESFFSSFECFFVHDFLFLLLSDFCLNLFLKSVLYFCLLRMFLFGHCE